MAGIQPVAIFKNKLYFLFGKENQYADTPGWSDFGGGIDKGETALKTAVREAQEELTGFLGGDKEIKRLLGKGTYNLKHNDYQMFICQLDYDETLPFYYNNNQRFLQKRLDPKLLEKSKIFEKSEIKWVCVDDLKKMRPQFRSYFAEISDILLEKKEEIIKYAKKHTRTSKKGTRKNGH